MENTEDQIIKIHKAKYILTEDGQILNKKILEELKVGSIVRISYELLENIHDKWSHDSPYVKVIKNQDDEFLGEVQNINRYNNLMHKYAIGTSENIWISKENIIEIPIKYNKNISDQIIKNETGKKVLVTGPLFSIEYERSDESDFTETDESESSVSDSESETS